MSEMGRKQRVPYTSNIIATLDELDAIEVPLLFTELDQVPQSHQTSDAATDDENATRTRIGHAEDQECTDRTSTASKSREGIDRGEGNALPALPPDIKPADGVMKGPLSADDARGTRELDFGPRSSQAVDILQGVPICIRDRMRIAPGHDAWRAPASVFVAGTHLSAS